MGTAAICSTSVTVPNGIPPTMRPVLSDRTVAISTVGRILAHLVKRGVVTPAPILRRRPGGRRIRFTAAERHAKRLPRGLKPTRPGEFVQIDTLFVNIRPDKPIKHFTAYDPVAKWTVGRVATNASAQSAAALLDKLIAEAPFRNRRRPGRWRVGVPRRLRSRLQSQKPHPLRAPAQTPAAQRRSRTRLELLALRILRLLRPAGPPRTHLHPQARTLWAHVHGLPGQKIITTHSPYFVQHVPFAICGLSG